MNFSLRTEHAPSKHNQKHTIKAAKKKIAHKLGLIEYRSGMDSPLRIGGGRNKGSARGFRSTRKDTCRMRTSCRIFGDGFLRCLAAGSSAIIVVISRPGANGKSNLPRATGRYATGGVEGLLTVRDQGRRVTQYSQSFH